MAKMTRISISMLENEQGDLYNHKDIRRNTIRGSSFVTLVRILTQVSVLGASIVNEDKVSHRDECRTIDNFE
jgi:hypothetical protein